MLKNNFAKGSIGRVATQLGHRLWSAVIARRVPLHRGVTLRQRGGLLSPLGLFGPETRSGQFQDDGMVDQPVDRGRRGHGILEDPLPLTEHEIATDEDALALVALGQKGK